MLGSTLWHSDNEFLLLLNVLISVSPCKFAGKHHVSSSTQCISELCNVTSSSSSQTITIFIFTPSEVRSEKVQTLTWMRQSQSQFQLSTIQQNFIIYSFSKLLILKLLTLEYQNTYSLYGIEKSQCLRLEIETFQPKVDKIETDDLVSNSFKIQFCNFWKEFCFKLNGFRR